MTDLTKFTIPELEAAILQVKLAEEQKALDLLAKKKEEEAKILVDVLDLLNQTMILMKDVKAGDSGKINLIKFAVEKLVSAEYYQAQELYDQYYNSNCY